MVELRENEIRILAALDKLEGKASVEQLMAECELPDAAVMRAALILQENSFAKIHAQPTTKIKLTQEGQTHAQNGLPEKRLIKVVIELGGKANLHEAAKRASLNPQFAQIALGWTQRKKWATFDPKTSTLIVVSTPEEGNDEKLLSTLCSREEITIDSLNRDLQEAIEPLKKRKAITVEEKTQRLLQITREGRQAIEAGAAELTVGKKEITKLTPELILKGEWRKVRFQKYSIEAPVANAWPGKKHPYLSFLDEVRAKLVTLGFKEMTGTAVETSFFNFDALYTPQDHPARELDGIYYIKSPQYGNIAKYSEAVKRVKETHQNGDLTGSKGWGYKYFEHEASRLSSPRAWHLPKCTYASQQELGNTQQALQYSTRLPA